VVNSVLAVDWWRGWQGPAHCRVGELSEVHRDEWEKHNRSFVALAAIEWKVLMSAANRSARTLSPGVLTEVRYESLCHKPIESLQSLFDFLDVEWSANFERRVRATAFRSSNEKWRRDLSDEQRDVLESVLGDALEAYGYR
jgi:hypothetical protein